MIDEDADVEGADIVADVVEEVVVAVVVVVVVALVIGGAVADFNGVVSPLTVIGTPDSQSEACWSSIDSDMRFDIFEDGLCVISGS